MSAEQRKILLFFWTSIKYLPVDGFQGLASRLYIYKSHEPGDRLPSSHTCFFRLCFPPYPSMAVMQDRLHLITQEHIGCSFGTWWMNTPAIWIEMGLTAHIIILVQIIGVFHLFSNWMLWWNSLVLFCKVVKVALSLVFVKCLYG